MDGNEAKKRLEKIGAERTAWNRQRNAVEPKLDQERIAVNRASGEREATVWKLAEPGADSAKLNKQIDALDEKIKIGARLVDALTVQIKQIDQSLAVLDVEQADCRRVIEVAENEKAYQEWMKQTTQHAQNTRQMLDASRAAYGHLNSLAETGKQKFGPRALSVLEPLLEQFGREQHNPTAHGWRNVAGAMLNGVTIHPMAKG